MTPSEDESIEILNEMSVDSQYIVAGREKCPTSGNWHWQGFLILHRRARDTELRKMYHQTIHWAAQSPKATNQQSADYCKKINQGDGVIPNETVFEQGELPDDNGKREAKRWKITREAAINGNLEEIPDDIFVCHYGNVRSIYKDFCKPPEDLESPTGTWIVGRSGFGKSHLARDSFPNAYKKNANKWWDGYQQQENVIIDDFDISHGVLAHHLKIWADKYGFAGESKGSAVPLRPKNLVVTSQYSIEEIWQDDATREALLRRFEVWTMNEPRKVSFITHRIKNALEYKPGSGTVTQFVGPLEKHFISDTIPATPTPTRAPTPATVLVDDMLATPENKYPLVREGAIYRKQPPRLKRGNQIIDLTNEESDED